MNLQESSGPSSYAVASMAKDKTEGWRGGSKIPSVVVLAAGV
jgi:hypothetical protein